MRAVVIAVVAMMAGFSKAQPQDLNAFFSGNDVYSWCQRDKSLALGYVAGLWDEALHGSFVLNVVPFGEAENVQRKYAKELFVQFCGPSKVVLEQVSDVFCGYLRDVPSDRHKPASLLFHAAMKKTWPCK
jgi:hypothetical protein